MTTAFAIFCDNEPIGREYVIGEPDRWLTFPTEREAHLDIIDDLEEHIRQFKAGEREYDAIDFLPSCHPEQVTIHPDRSITTTGGTTFPPP